MTTGLPEYRENTEMKNNSKVILIVESDPDVIYLIGEAIDEIRLDVNLVVVQSGMELLDYLLKKGKYGENGDYSLPGLILLGVDIPEETSEGILPDLKKLPKLKRIPVVIMGPNQSEKTISAAYDMGASGYIVKTAKFQELCGWISRISSYWFETVLLAPIND